MFELVHGDQSLWVFSGLATRLIQMSLEGSWGIGQDARRLRQRIDTKAGAHRCRSSA